MADESFKSAAFKKLRRQWAEKLYKKGFRDIEDEHGNLTDHQSVQDFAERIGFRSGVMESIRDYYDWAEEMVLFGQFKSAADRKIWGLHAKALSFREIAKSVPFHWTWIGKKVIKIRAYLRLQVVTDDMREALIEWEKDPPRKATKSKR